MAVSDRFTRFAGLLREGPAFGFRYALAFVRGTVYAIYFRLRRRDVRIALPFFAFERVSIRGPGRVRIGPHAFVLPSVFRGLSIVTLSPGAEVVIGGRCALGGLVIRCRGRVALGERVMTAAALVQDVHFLDHDAAVPAGPPTRASAPTVLGANVWLGLGSIVLGGTRLGDDVVVAAGGLCSGIEVDDYAIVSGSPALRALPIPRIVAMKAAS